MAGNDSPPLPPMSDDERFRAAVERPTSGGFGGGLGGLVSAVGAPLARVGDRITGALDNVRGAALQQSGVALDPTLQSAITSRDEHEANQNAAFARALGAPRRLGQVALGLPTDPYIKPSTAPGVAPTLSGDLRPSYDETSPYESIKAAPTLDPNYGRIGRTVGGSYGVGGDGGLRAAFDASKRDELQQMQLGADNERTLGIDQALRSDQMSRLQEENAARMQRDAELQQQADQRAAEQHQAFMQRNEQLANEIGSMKVDPGRLLRSADLATQFTIGLGAALGGVNAAAMGQTGNSSLDRLDKLVEQDINSQMNAIDNKKASLSARSSLFGQMMQETGDRRLAAMQTRVLMYDAMKTKLKADADRLGIPELRDNAEILANGLDVKKATLQRQMNGDALQTFLAGQRAAAQAAGAAEERKYKHEQDRIKNDQEQQRIDIEAGKAGGGGKDAAERTVVLDNENALALNKNAAEKWGEYNHGRTIVASRIRELKEARDAGDVGKYTAARGFLLEEVPKLLGYARGPSEGQLKVTLGPETIPEYTHWYKSGVLYGRDQGRAAEKLHVLDSLLADSDKSMRENTFGAHAPVAGGANAPHFVEKTNASARVK